MIALSSGWPATEEISIRLPRGDPRVLNKPSGACQKTADGRIVKGPSIRELQYGSKLRVRARRYPILTVVWLACRQGYVSLLATVRGLGSVPREAGLLRLAGKTCPAFTHGRLIQFSSSQASSAARASLRA